MPLRSESIRRWWPTTQSLDPVEGPVEAVGTAVGTELRRLGDPGEIRHQRARRRAAGLTRGTRWGT